MPKKCPWHAQHMKKDMAKIGPRYAKDIHKICELYGQGMPKTDPKYGQDLPNELWVKVSKDFVWSWLFSILSKLGGLQKISNVIESINQWGIGSQEVIPCWPRTAYPGNRHKPFSPILYICNLWEE